MTTPPDPLALLRSRSYLVLLALAAIIGVPVSAVAYFFLALVSKLQGWIFTSLPKELGFHAEPLWWPILPLVLAGVLVSSDPEVPARHGRPFPSRRVQGGRRPAARDRASRHRARGLCHLEPGRGARARRAADRPRRRARRPRGPAGQAGRSGPSPVRDGRRGEFRRDQHPARLAPDRRVPADGSLRPGRPHDAARAGTWPAGRGRRIAHLHRPGRLDRARHVLAGDSRPPARRCAHGRRILVGAGDRDNRCPGRLRNPVAGPVPAATCRAADPPAHAGSRPGRRGPGDHVRRGHRKGLLRGAVLRAIRPRPAHQPTAPAIPSARCCSS